MFQNVPCLENQALFGGLKITFNYLKNFWAHQKGPDFPGRGHFGTYPKILESLEGPEGYLCPGIHILGIISICGKPFYTSDEGLLIFLNPSFEIFAIRPNCMQLCPTVLRIAWYFFTWSIWFLTYLISFTFEAKKGEKAIQGCFFRRFLANSVKWIAEIAS